MHTISVSPDQSGGRFVITTPHGSASVTLGPVDLLAMIRTISGLPCLGSPAASLPCFTQPAASGSI